MKIDSPLYIHYMNRRLLQFGLFALLAIQVLADRIPEDAARGIASKFITGDSRMRKAQAAGTALSLAAATRGYYAYNIGTDGGFVLVAADDNVASTVLGYSDCGGFDTGRLPENVRWWLGEYDRQVELVSKLPKQNGGLRLAVSDSASARDFAPIEPLITAKWNQTAPYNNMCPELNGERSVTGCMATALAQIMRHHRWPEQGNSTISYRWEAGDTTLVRDFSGNVYNYDAMTDTYDESSSQESKDAVALLMADVGYALKMQYSPVSSGSNNYIGVSGLANNMGYANGASYHQRRYYSKDEWNGMVYNELAASRPVYFSGYNRSSGHAFVCDGYSGDGYFHFNWGWGGYCDGNFLLTVLDPGSQQGAGGSSDGYALDQEVIVGMQRDAKEAVPNIVFDSPISITPQKTLRTGSATITSAANSFGSLGFNPTNATLGVKVVGSDSGAVYIPSSTTLSLNYYESSPDSVFTIGLTSFPKENGTYGVYPAYRDEASGKWHDMRHLQKEGVFSLVATVKGDSVTFGDMADKQGTIGATGLAVTSEGSIFEGKDFYCGVKITCSGSEYSGTLLLGLVSNDAIHAYNTFYCNLFAGEEQDFSVRITAPTAGEYALYAIQETNGGYESFGDSVSVTVTKMPTGTVTVTSYSASSPPYAGSKFVITADVECAGGDYNAPIKVLYADTNSGYALGTMGQTKVNLADGDKQTVPIECTAPDSAAQYRIGILSYDNQIISTIYIFTVEERPLDILSLARPLAIDGQDGGVDPEHLQLKAVVKCNGEGYNNQLAAYIFEDEVNVVGSLYTQLDIAKGDSATVTFAGACSNLKPGVTYEAYVYYIGEADGTWYPLCDENGETGSVTFTVQQPSGIAATKDAKATERISIYTPSGTLLGSQTGEKPDLSALPSGIYIIKAGGKTYKKVH